jgi:transcription elongation factor Elf1
MSKDNFSCPVCGSVSYSEVAVDNDIAGPGYRRWVVYYVCDGCSVLFKDPEKFSKGGHNDAA